MNTRRGQLRHNLLPIRLDAFREPDVAGLWRMLNNLGSPAERLLNPVFAFPFAVLASVQPDMVQPRKLSCCTIHEQHDPITIHDIGGMHLGFEDEALGIDEQVPLTTSDFFACIIATWSTQSYGFDASLYH